jgi:hypothetical protein
LPNGVSFLDNHDGTGTLGGLSGAGVNDRYPLTIIASNGAAASASQSFTLVMTGGLPTVQQRAYLPLVLLDARGASGW